MKLLQGGSGSGNFGHGGRPGKVGGSSEIIDTDYQLERSQWDAINKDFHPTTDAQYALGHYIGDDSGIMNSFLDGDKIETDYPNGFANELPKVVKDLEDSAIPSPTDVTLYRGSNSDRFAKIQIGGEFTNKSFLSSSNSASQASVFTTPSKKNPIPVLTRLHLKKGVKVIPGNWGEQEIILLPGHTFRVVNKSEVNVQTGWRDSGAVRHYTKTIIVDLELTK